MSQQQITLTREALKEITLFANQPLKRILPSDTWVILMITDEDILALARGLQTIARKCNAKAKITPSTISEKNVRATVQVVLKQGGLGDVDDTTANGLISDAKALINDR